MIRLWYSKKKLEDRVAEPLRLKLQVIKWSLAREANTEAEANVSIYDIQVGENVGHT